MSSTRMKENLQRDLFVLEDEQNPHGSKVDTVWPSTILDQVFDQTSPTRKNLRTILEELRYEILTGGRGNIVFPVTSVNGQTGDVNITPSVIGLGNVDNTSDIDKPLSNPQREALMDILEHYDFKVNLDALYEHMLSTDNPHDVRIEQINKDEALERFVLRLIDKHNTSTQTNIHADMRRKISTLWNLVDQFDDSIKANIERTLDSLNNHYEDPNAHINIFRKKEDVENKIMAFNVEDNVNHTTYPSSRAVAEYITERLSMFRDTLPDVKDWIDDIQVVDNRDDLPVASKDSHRKMFFIRNGVTSHDEIAVCRENTDGSFSWDYSTLGTYSRFNPVHFIDSNVGFSLNIKTVVQEILGEESMAERINNSVVTALPLFLESYYTKDQIDRMHLIGSITMLPGTMDGTIRYYLNDDESTMSDDVRVAGLQRLAFLEHVTENELWDQAVHERHILSKAITKRHLQEKIVAPIHMTCGYMKILGNTNDSSTDGVNEISMNELASILGPIIKQNFALY